MTTAERRRHSRVEVQLASELEHSGARIGAIMRDLSIGGAFVATTQRFAYGDPVVVHVRLPGIDQDVALPGTVRWLSPDGCGVQFAPIGVRETHAIVELTSKRA